MEFIRFFLGTPRRLLLTLVAIACLVASQNPGFFQRSLHNLGSVVAPIIAQLLVLGIVVYGLQTIFFGRGGGRRR